MSLSARILRTRWVVRAPITLFRHGWGQLFGGRLLLLEHVGRSSGRVRYVVLEVVAREPGAVVVASGFGRRSQWFRNLAATPGCHVVLGRTRYRAEAVVLGPAERDATLADYARRHPRAWQRLAATMAELNGTDDPDIPLVRLELRGTA